MSLTAAQVKKLFPGLKGKPEDFTKAFTKVVKRRHRSKSPKRASPKRARSKSPQRAVPPTIMNSIITELRRLFKTTIMSPDYTGEEFIPESIQFIMGKDEDHDRSFDDPYKVVLWLQKHKCPCFVKAEIAYQLDSMAYQKKVKTNTELLDFIRRAPATLRKFVKEGL